MFLRNLLAKEKNTFPGFLAILIWSFSPLLVIGLNRIPIFELLFFEFLFSFFTFSFRYFIAKKKETFLHCKKKDLFVASLTLLINQTFLYFAFQYSSSPKVFLTSYLWPNLLIFFSCFLPGEKFSFSYFASSLIALYTTYKLLFLNGDCTVSHNELIACFLAFFSSISWASYSLYIKYQNSSSASQYIPYASGLNAIASLFIHLAFEKFTLPNALEITKISILGIFQMGLAFYLWERSLKKGSIKLLGLASYSIPILSNIVLVLFKKSPFDANLFIAGIVISITPTIPLIKNIFVKKHNLLLSKIKTKRKLAGENINIQKKRKASFTKTA